MRLRSLKFKKFNAVIVIAVINLMLLASSLLFPLAKTQAETVTPGYGFSKVVHTNVSGQVWGNSIEVAKDGAIYTVGTYEGNTDFDPSSGFDNHSHSGGQDAFLTKYNADGSYAYTETWGSIGDDYAYSVSTDDQLNVYVTGYFNGTVDFNPESGVDNHVSNGDKDVFFTRFNADGSYAYTKTWGGTGADVSFKNARDVSNNLYVLGKFSNTVDFNPGVGTDNHTANQLSDWFLTKYNADGSYAYTKTWGGTDNEYQAGSLAFDSQNNLYLNGSYKNTVDFNPGVGTDNHTANGDSDVFLTKYNADGSYAYTKTWGSPGYDYSTPLAIDSQGNIYVGSGFSNTVDFNPGLSIDNHTSSGDLDSAITKYNADGSYAYTKTWGGTNYDTVDAFVIDSADNLHVANVYYSSSIDFNPGAGSDIKSGTGNGNMALTTFNSDDSYRQTVIWDGDGYDEHYSAALDSSDNIYLTGYIGGTSVDLDPYAGDDTRSLSGNGDLFITKLTQTYKQNVTAPTGTTVTAVSDGTVANDGQAGVTRSSNVTLRLSTTDGVPLADALANLDQDRDWSQVTSGSDANAKKAFVHGLTSAPGAPSSFSLYIPKAANDSAVIICPGAASLEAVNSSCSNKQTLSTKNSNVSIVTINGKTYWKVSGLTGTGGLSANIPGLPLTGGGRLSSTNIATLVLGSMMILGAVYRFKQQLKHTLWRNTSI